MAKRLQQGTLRLCGDIPGDWIRSLLTRANVSYNGSVISVVIPALDEQAFLSVCLKSLSRQKCCEEREIIVADNGSSDATAEIAEQLGATVVRCPQKKSVFFARRMGARQAHGEILAQADADTVYPENWLATIADYFARLPEAVALTG